MDRRPATQVPDVSDIDLDYRPRSYFWAADLKLALPSSVAGETRRQMVRAFIEGDCPVPDGLDAAVLDEAMRAAWGRIHPSHMGGEYLPPSRNGEVEIARISLQSVTADQISVRARRMGRHIGYCVVDEYPETSTYVCRPARSVSPLSLGELIGLMEAASDGGSIIFPILAMNMQGASRPTELATFITVTSDFYADLGLYYRALIDAWLEGWAQENRDES